MATAMTYTSLLADMRRYLERGALVDTDVYVQLPSLVNLAERAIANEMKFQGMTNVVTTMLVQGVSVYAKPDRWRQTISMNFGTGTSNNTRTPIFPRAYEYSRTYWPDSSVEAQPLFYSDYNLSDWLITPTPDADYPLEILYYEQPPYLDDVNQTNFFTTYAPNALLYRSLLEATPFLKNDERIPVWQALYGQQLQALNTQDLNKIVDRSATRKEP